MAMVPVQTLPIRKPYSDTMYDSDTATWQYYDNGIDPDASTQPEGSRIVLNGGNGNNDGPVYDSPVYDSPQPPSNGPPNSAGIATRGNGVVNSGYDVVIPERSGATDGMISKLQGSSAGDYKLADPSISWRDPGGWGADATKASIGSANIRQGPRNITAKELTSWQLNNLLDENGRYMQSARGYADARSNSRGLINSSIAIGNSQRAAIDAGLPIAQADAGVYSASALSAQEAGQKSLLDQAAAQNAFNSQKALNQQNISGNIALGEQQLAGLLAEIKSKQALQAQALASGDRQLAVQLASDIEVAELKVEADMRIQSMADTGAMDRQVAGDFMTITNDDGTTTQVNIAAYLKEAGLDVDLTKLDVQARAEFAGNATEIMGDFTRYMSEADRDESLDKPGVREDAKTTITENTVGQLNDLATIYGYDTTWSVRDFA